MIWTLDDIQLNFPCVGRNLFAYLNLLRLSTWILSEILNAPLGPNSETLFDFPVAMDDEWQIGPFPKKFCFSSGGRR
jgi:hypothetical protein